MEHVINTYYADNARKLHSVVDKILLNFGSIYDKDVDDFYSLANEVFVIIIKRYDGRKPFEAFLYSCLSYKIKSEITKRNCYKRKADRLSVTIDMPAGDSGDCTIGDMLPGMSGIEDEVIERTSNGYSSKMLLYLNRLSKVQKRVLELTAEGYSPYEIQKILHISKKEYTDAVMAIHSYRNVSVLF